MKKIFVVFLFTCILAFAFGEGAQEDADGPEYIILGTSSVGGSYYMYGGGIASYINTYRDDIIITSETTRGSGENAVMLGDRLDFALINGNVLYLSKSRDGRTNARGIMAVDVAPSHWVTLEKSGITEIEDLVGERISIGAPGSGAENTAMNILNAYGIWEEVEPNVQRLGFSESATALKDGHIKAFAGGSATPMPAVAELAATADIRLLSISDTAMVNLIQKYPPYMKWTIPAGTYEGIDYPVHTSGLPSCFVVDESVDEEIVYNIVKELYQEKALEYMKNVYYAFNPYPAKEFYDQINVPLHPGAERFYREEGLIE